MKSKLCKKSYPVLLLLLLLFAPSILSSQLATTNDTSDTPFRKGRWLTGLSGSIGSNTINVRSSDEKTTTSEFGLDLSTGRFIKDRWLLGGTLNANRANTSGSIDNTTESLFIGPFLSYYLSPDSRGSLFLTFSPGYVLYRDENRFNDSIDSAELSAEGDGFGSLLGFGYSYVIDDRIAFDIGFDVNLFWVGVDERLEPEGTMGSDDISLSNISFNFGFNVLLDKFFF